jgi:anti-sigma factor RsiW
MGCDEYADRIGEIAGAGEQIEHFATCPECARRLRRARAIVAAMSGLPRVALSPDAGAAIRARVLAPRGTPVRRLVQAAAVLLLLGGCLALASYVTGSSTYQPLDLQVIDVDANGAHDEDLAFDQIFGPERTSLVATGGPDRR